MHVYIHTYIHTRPEPPVNACMYMYTCICIPVCMYINTYAACMYMYTCIYVNACIHTYIQGLSHLLMLACICMHVYVYRYVCIYIHTIHEPKQVAQLPPAWICMYIYVYIHTYIHTRHEPKQVNQLPHVCIRMYVCMYERHVHVCIYTDFKTHARKYIIQHTCFT